MSFSLTPTGASSEYIVPTKGSSPTAIVEGPDEATWFLETFGDKIGRITPPK